MKRGWSNFQTLMLKYFKRVDFRIKDGTKTIRLATWKRGDSTIFVKYSHSNNRERLLSVRVIRGEEKKIFDVDLKTWSFGFDEKENSPFIKWEINNGTGFYQLNFPQND